MQREYVFIFTYLCQIYVLMHLSVVALRTAAEKTCFKCVALRIDVVALRTKAVALRKIA